MPRYRSPNDHSRRFKRRYLLLLMPFSLLLFFGGFALQAYLYIKEEKLPPAYHNALKHAMAAKVVYQTLDMLCMPEPEEKVIQLGLLNERMEQHVKFNSPDSTLEMIKDTSNNYVGIVLAEWSKENRCQQPMAHLVKSGTLVAQSYDMRMARSEKEMLSETRDLEVVNQWLADNRKALRAQTIRQLNTCKK